jgi:glutathione peroxidase-family protein
MSWKGSPRYWIYSASCSLLFELAENDASPKQTKQPRVLAGLPVSQNAARGPQGWQEFAKDILWNYKKFLVGTRA